jgi:hypothetical protein
VLVSKENPVGISFTPSATHTITYQGSETQVNFK